MLPLPMPTPSQSPLHSQTLPLTAQAHAWLRPLLQAGDVAIDATAGNGQDTLFLAKCVGTTGRVFAFDLQPSAIERTEARLESAGVNHATLLQRCHSELAAAIPSEHHGHVAAVMFNLGYLPGGDRALVTRPETTCAALSQTLELLRPAGAVSILVYPGHPGGEVEAAAVAQWLSQLPTSRYATQTLSSQTEAATAPQLHVVQKQR